MRCAASSLRGQVSAGQQIGATKMQTYSDYSGDTGLGFGVSSDYEDAPELRRASDVGGSEIYFRCDDDTCAAIEAEIASDDQCGPDDDGPDGSDSGLTQFWEHVERVIRANCDKDVWDSEDEMLRLLNKRTT